MLWLLIEWYSLGHDSWSAFVEAALWNGICLEVTVTCCKECANNWDEIS